MASLTETCRVTQVLGRDVLVTFEFLEEEVLIETQGQSSGHRVPRRSKAPNFTAVGGGLSRWWFS